MKEAIEKLGYSVNTYTLARKNVRKILAVCTKGNITITGQGRTTKSALTDAFNQITEQI